MTRQVRVLGPATSHARAGLADPPRLHRVDTSVPTPRSLSVQAEGQGDPAVGAGLVELLRQEVHAYYQKAKVSSRALA